MPLRSSIVGGRVENEENKFSASKARSFARKWGTSGFCVSFSLSTFSVQIRDSEISIALFQLLRST